MKRLSIIALLLAAAGLLVAATLPTSSPTHSGFSQGQLLGYIADNTQRMATGSGVATLPVASPAHSGMSQNQILGYVADYTQDIAANTARIYRPETYGAVVNDGMDDLPAIQAASDAAITEGGGIVQLDRGTYDVIPVNGIAILTDGAFVLLRGSGEGTQIRFASTATTTAFCGIAGKRYNTCTAPYTAAPVWVEDLRLTCDSYTDVDGHNLLAICHAPWGIVRRVGFEQIAFHALEINQSRNVVVEDCYTYGTGNMGTSIMELDFLGSAGVIATGGTHSQLTPVENVTIRRFVQRVARTDLTIATDYDILELSHTHSNCVVRNILVEDCRFIPHRNSSVAPGTTRTVLGFNVAALPLLAENIVIRNNYFAPEGGLSGTSIIIDLSAASAATRNIRNIVVEGNTIFSPHVHAIRAGSLSSATSPRTSITDAILRSHDGIRIEGNIIGVYLNGNSNAARAVRSVAVGAARSVVIRNNTVAWPDVANGSGWGTSTVATAAYAFFLDHVQNLTLENNTVEITRPETGGTAGLWSQVYAFVFACGAYEIQSTLSGHWSIVNNKAIGNGNIGINLACGFLGLYTSGTTGISNWSSANKLRPRISGRWTGNSSIQTGTGTYTHTLQSTYPTYFVCAGSVTNTPLNEAALASLGAHDWQPGSEQLGTVTTVPAGTTMPDGWELYDGRATTALNWLREAAWNQRLGLSGTATLPTTANTYIRLSGN